MPVVTSRVPSLVSVPLVSYAMDETHLDTAQVIFITHLSISNEETASCQWGFNLRDIYSTECILPQITYNKLYAVPHVYSMTNYNNVNIYSNLYQSTLIEN